MVSEKLICCEDDHQSKKDKISWVKGGKRKEHGLESYGNSGSKGCTPREVFSAEPISYGGQEKKTGKIGCNHTQVVFAKNTIKWNQEEHIESSSSTGWMGQWECAGEDTDTSQMILSPRMVFHQILGNLNKLISISFDRW